MDKREQLEVQKLRDDLRRLQNVVAMLLNRVSALEKRTRTLRAGVHGAGLSTAALQRSVKSMSGDR